MTNDLIRKMQDQGVPKSAGTLSCGVLIGEIGPKDVAQDGGPGSGNFGHKGRPGLVGGSGPGGGSQYRGGRPDMLSEQTLVGSGPKEVQKHPEPEKSESIKTDYEFYHKDMPQYFGTMEDFMQVITGEQLSPHEWGAMNGVEKMQAFKGLNKKFVDTMKHGKLSPTKCRQALSAMMYMRRKISMEHDANGGFWYEGEFEVTPHMADRLSEDERNRLLRIMNAVEYNMQFNYEDPYKDLVGLNHNDFLRIDEGLSAMPLRTNKEQDIVREYVLLQEKMFTGEVPADESQVELERQKKKEEAEQKKTARITLRDQQQKLFEQAYAGYEKTARIETIKQFDSKTFDSMPVEEISQTVKRLGFFTKDSQFISSPLVADEVYRQTAKAYKDVIDRFPFMAGEFGGFGDNYSASRALMGCAKDAYQPMKTEIMINYAKLSTEEHVKEVERKGIEQGFYSRADEEYIGTYHAVAHEIGHAVANWLHRYIYGDFHGIQFPNGWGYDNEVADLLKKRTFKAMGMSASAENITREVSKYASASRLNKEASQPKSATKSDEFFAECFAEMMCTKEHRPAIAEFEKQLNKLIKESGITGLTTGLNPTTLPKLIR